MSYAGPTRTVRQLSEAEAITVVSTIDNLMERLARERRRVVATYMPRSVMVVAPFEPYGPASYGVLELGALIGAVGRCNDRLKTVWHTPIDNYTLTIEEPKP